MKAITAAVVLAVFGWTTCGGNAWAEDRVARRDPAKVLRQLAEEPRLALSPAEKEYLRRAADRIDAGPRAVPQEVRVPAATPAERDLTVEMQAVATDLERLGAQTEPSAQAPAEKRLDRSTALAGLKARLQTLDQQVLGDFAVVETKLRAAHLPGIILERQAKARARYQESMRAVLRDLDAAGQSEKAAGAQAAIAAAVKKLRTSGNDRPQQKLDPSRLPFRGAKPVARKPAVLPEGKLKSAVALKTLTPPAPAELAANEDVQITPDIQALATSLGNQPLQIYNWVRNNIEYVPTYGSVQGSQMTLVAKRGNAFDTASLLIALLRAAGVPAHYVTGTVEVPSAAAMNWVGGAESPGTAQQLLGQGGVPNVGLSSGGSITAIRIDHVWVEAFLRYVPGRGAAAGAGDTWVPMDASFKQHQFTSRSDLFTAVPVSNVFQPGDHLFDVDESLGKITNVDTTALDNRFGDWATQSDQYITSHGIQGTVDGLLGGQTIVPQATTIFPASLPYRIVTRGTAVSTLPASLRHSVTLNGFASDFDRALGNPAFSVTVSLPALNSRRLGITFDPATSADAATLAAARNGGASSLPAYLINVAPVVKVDGVTLGTGGSVQLGSFYSIDAVLQGPDGPTTVPFQIVAGDELVAGVTGNGVTREVIEKRFADNPVDNAPEYLHEVGLHYWMESDYLGGIAAKPLGVHFLRLPSIGFFSSPLTVSYLFGFPRSAVYASRNMDVRQSLLGAAGEDPSRVVAFFKQAGTQGSYLEGSVFDQLEGRSTPAIKGISSVHLLSAAAAQGIPIYRITQANASAVLPLLSLSAAVKSDISTAVSQGKTVMAPERNLDIGPWSGAGYIIQDDTGAGAYLISGGANGGGLIDCVKELVPQFVKVLLLVLLLVLLIILIILILGALAEVLAAAAAAAGAAAAAFAGFMGLLEGLGGLALAF